MMNEHTYSDGYHVWSVKDLLASHTWSAGRMTVQEILSHSDRVTQANLNYPILLTPEGYIGDGCHRIIKAWKCGWSHILVVKLEVMPTPLRLVSEEPSV